MLRYKKVLISFGIIATIVGSVGCGTKKAESITEVQLFDMKQGMDVTMEYLKNISKGDIEIAKSFCSEELINSNKQLEAGVSQITSFVPEASIEGSNFGYFIYNVVRTSNMDPKSDLESFTLKVENQNKHYVITEIKAKAEKEVFVQGKGLRIIGEDGGSSNLVINLNNVPKDTYLRDNKIMLYKDKVPNDEFGKVSLSFTGKRIAITTTNNIDSYICLAFIDETLMASTEPQEGGAQAASPNELQQLEEVLEKPIAKKIVSVDLLKSSKVTGFNFSKEEDKLAVSYTNSNNVRRVRLYKTDDGSIIKAKFDEIFPEDKYNVENGMFVDDNFMFKVSALNNSVEVNNELIGEYEMNLTTLEVKKL